jgi:hypothetical protein
MNLPRRIHQQQHEEDKVSHRVRSEGSQRSTPHPPPRKSSKSKSLLLETDNADIWGDVRVAPPKVTHRRRPEKVGGIRL